MARSWQSRNILKNFATIWEVKWYRTRYYDPSLQRFLGEDPIGFSSKDFNFYRYVGNNPVSLVDPRGLAGSDSFDNECHNMCVEDELCNGSGGEWGYRKCYNKCVEDKYDESVNWDAIRRAILRMAKTGRNITIKVGGRILVFVGGVLITISAP